LFVCLFVCLQAGPVFKQLEGSECPLHVVHPPTGEEFALGCGVCRNAQTF
jgi:E3 ubiquitin-protein ligase MYCBP2